MEKKKIIPLLEMVSTAFISNQKWEKQICNQKSLHKQPLLFCPFSVPVSDGTVSVFSSSGDVQKPAEFYGRCAHSQGRFQWRSSSSWVKAVSRCSYISECAGSILWSDCTVTICEANRVE